MALKVQAAADGVEMTIKPRINWLSLFALPSVVFILFGVGIDPALEDLGGHSQPASNGRDGFSIALFGGIAVSILFSLVRMVFGSERLTVATRTLEIHSRIFGWSASERSFPNSVVENLRYEEWSGGRSGIENAIRFECAGETVTFARQLDRSPLIGLRPTK